MALWMIAAVIVGAFSLLIFMVAALDGYKYPEIVALLPVAAILLLYGVFA